LISSLLCFARETFKNRLSVDFYYENCVSSPIIGIFCGIKRKKSTSITGCSDSPEPLVEEVIKMDAGIQKAEKKMAHVSMDKEALRAYQMREMALSDWTSGLNHARREGIREGKREGKLEGIREIAAKMKRRGTPLSQIMEDTGLSAEDIAAL
jgi:predicted transposase/invertase (TIGR01784 family)